MKAKEYLLHRIKKDKDDKYHLLFENDEIIINEDIYTDYFLYENKMISENEFQELKDRSLKMNIFSYVYRLLSTRIYSAYQLKEKLINVKKVKPYLAKQIIEELKEKGVINDNYYVSLKIESLELKGYGYYRIRETLFQDGIDIDKINYSYDEKKERERILLMLPSLEKKFSSLSFNKMKDSIYRSLLSYGYDETVVLEAMKLINEDEIRKKEKEKSLKAYLLMISRYTNEEKKIYKDKIIDKLKRNGYRYSDIMMVIEECEND